MTSQTAEAAHQFLFWWVGDATFEAEVTQAFHNNLGSRFCKSSLVHIASMESLSFHRPRAPEVTLALALPTIATWSRARASSRHGPPTLRSCSWPWGTPGLTVAHREAVERDNKHLRLALAVCEALRSSDSAWLFSFLEQFGCTVGEPAPTAWDVLELRSWAKQWKLWRFAVYQCEFGASRSRPTGILTNLPLNDRRLQPGWPVLSVRDDGTSEYSGPLNKICSCAHRHQPTPLRMHGGPWDVDSLSALLAVVLAKTECRGLLAGWGDKGLAAAALQRKREEDNSSSDSETTVAEQPSPAEAAGLTARKIGTDRQLCAALNIQCEDRCLYSLFHCTYSLFHCTKHQMRGPLSVRLVCLHTFTLDLFSRYLLSSFFH